MDESASQEAEQEGDAAYKDGLQRIEPEAGRAIYALSVAMELLESAQQKAAESGFEDAIILSRDSMRLASSALLFEDGYVATSLDSSCGYLKRRYGDSIPIAEWVAVEGMASGRPADSILRIFSRSKGSAEQDAKKALESAGKFIGAASAIIRPIAQELAKEMSDMASDEPREEPDEPGEESGQSEAAAPQGQSEDIYGEAS